MWDPISLFYCMWVLNAKELPNQRLNVREMIDIKEQTIINNELNNQVTLREGV